MFFTHRPRRNYWPLLLLALLLGGCRSGRLAFQFQPVSVQHPVKAAHAALSELHSESRLPGSCTPQSLNGARLKDGVQLRNRATFGVQLRKSRRTATLIQKTFSHVVEAAKAKPTSAVASPWKGLLFPGGLAICVAAVIIGINLGGFLGLAGGYVLFFAGALVGALGYAGPDKPDPTKPKSERGLRPYLNLLFGSLASVLLIGGGLGLLLHGGTSYLAAILTGAAMMLSYYVYNRLKNHSSSNTN